MAGAFRAYGPSLRIEFTSPLIIGRLDPQSALSHR